MGQAPQKRGWQCPEPVPLEAELQQLLLGIQQPLREVLQLVLIQPQDLQVGEFAKDIYRQSRDPVPSQVQKS